MHSAEPSSRRRSLARQHAAHCVLHRPVAAPQERHKETDRLKLHCRVGVGHQRHCRVGEAQGVVLLLDPGELRRAHMRGSARPGERGVPPGLNEAKISPPIVDVARVAHCTDDLDEHLLVPLKRMVVLHDKFAEVHDDFFEAPLHRYASQRPNGALWLGEYPREDMQASKPDLPPSWGQPSLLHAVPRLLVNHNTDVWVLPEIGNESKPSFPHFLLDCVADPVPSKDGSLRY
mmetsp:Transcript_4346/g.10517  ORF Transcript_4346/g.10517 Transcript_4346/m.10517 type:complete len:232 (-) Transcript_4346:11-706(-)